MLRIRVLLAMTALFQSFASANAAIIDPTHKSADLGHVYANNDPSTGQYGTVYIGSEYFSQGTDVFVFATYAHELGNILDYNLTQNKKEDTHGNPNDPIDKDTGSQVERCVFGGYVQPDGSLR
jgi:hypothetical protein